MIIHIDDKPCLIWLPKRQPEEVAGSLDIFAYFQFNSQYQTGDIYKADCPECKASGQGKPMAGYENSFGIGSRPQGDCQHCNQGQIEYKIVKPELKQVHKIYTIINLDNRDDRNRFADYVFENFNENYRGKYLLISELDIQHHKQSACIN